MSELDTQIAIIGLAGRFPDAPNLNAFWALIKNGREAIHPFSDAEMLAAGVDPARLTHPDYVKAGTVIPDVECFDAAFFAMNGQDAAILDPQQRLFLECTWQALEQAGYPPTTTDARIGLYAGLGANSYQRNQLEPNWADLLAAVGDYRLTTLCDKDFMATRAAYKLNLTGPALTVQTACSTSLVAVHMACQSLLNVECDMALAGGVSLFLPQRRGYLYQEGMILSPDGHCRAFDAQAQGTVVGGGVGVVMLKRLEEALADGDTIHAVILGSAINNDGADKIGYTAPSVGGQTDVILEAQAVANVHPEEIDYIEAHGTGTPLGDPIELQALTDAFRANSDRIGYCGIGSVKPNIGHADTAAGIAGLLKTVLALKHRQLPPSLHFAQPNPQIGFADSPFFVNDRLQDWAATAGRPRCAGVSSFGIGGTNAHVIVAEAPEPEVSTPLRTTPSHTVPSRTVQLLTLSAKTPTALDAIAYNLGAHLQQHPELPLSDVAYTLNRGRQPFAQRRIVVCANADEVIAKLTQPQKSTHALSKARDVVFMFPGQGTQYPQMARGLYDTEAVFRDTLDQCAALLRPHLGQDVRQIIFSADADKLRQTAVAQPALFAVEYALAQLWLAWGVQPVALVGHSLGEYVAACLAGVFSLADALVLVAQRGKLLQALPTGAMLVASLGEDALQPWLSAELSLAAINGIESCVLSGTHSAIATVEQQLQTAGVGHGRLHTSHAFHSQMMAPALEPFAQYVEQVERKAPTIPFLSNVTGTWISPQQATDPAYWAGHLHHTMRFADNLQTLFEQAADVLLEVGPGQGLYALAQRHPHKPAHFTVLHSLPNQQFASPSEDVQKSLMTLGELWANGVAIDWDGFYTAEMRHRRPLPTYPFERQRYWIDTRQQAPQTVPQSSLQTGQPLLFESNGIGSSGIGSSAANGQSGVNAQRGHQTIKREKSTLSATEQQIAAIWSQSLGITMSAIDGATDFFAAGGDSLLATQVMTRLREQLNVKVDTHALLQAPTVAQLATIVTEQIAHPNGQMNAQMNGKPHLPDLIVPIQTGDPRQPPLFLLHPVGGHVYFYRELARYLDPQLPIYGIRAQGVEGEAEPLTSIAAMTVVYTAALQAVQPQGPYYVGGASFGGTLAYAMAQRLLAQEEMVAFLALIDTPSLGNMPVIFEDSAEILYYLLKIGENTDISLDYLRTKNEVELIDFFVQRNGEMTPQELRTMLKLFKTNLQAMRAYTPPPYAGKLHYFLAQERDEFNAQTPAYGWIGLAKQGIEIYTIPGNHISMNTEPYVQHLAKHLGNCLKEAYYE